MRQINKCTTKQRVQKLINIDPIGSIRDLYELINTQWLKESIKAKEDQLKLRMIN